MKVKGPLIYCLCDNKNGEFGGPALKTPEVPTVTNYLTSATNPETVLHSPNTPRFGVNIVKPRVGRRMAKEKFSHIIISFSLDGVNVRILAV